MHCCRLPMPSVRRAACHWYVVRALTCVVGVGNGLFMLTWSSPDLLGEGRCSCGCTRIITLACGHLACRYFVASQPSGRHTCECGWRDSGVRRRAWVAEWNYLSRLAETPEQRAARLEVDAERHRMSRSAETPGERAARLQVDTHRHAGARKGTFAHFEHDPGEALIKFHHDGGASHFPAFLKLQSWLQSRLRDGEEHVGPDVLKPFQEEVEAETVTTERADTILREAGRHLDEQLAILICGCCGESHWVHPDVADPEFPLRAFREPTALRADPEFCDCVERRLPLQYRRVPTWHRVNGVIYQVHREAVETVNSEEMLRTCPDCAHTFQVWEEARRSAERAGQPLSVCLSV